MLHSTVQCDPDAPAENQTLMGSGQKYSEQAQRVVTEAQLLHRRIEDPQEHKAAQSVEKNTDDKSQNFYSVQFSLFGIAK